MAPRIDWFARLAAAAARIDRADAAADKAARALERVSRPDAVRKYERQGKAAEARRRDAERAYREAERKLLGRPARERKKPERKPERRPPPPAPGASYMVTLDYKGRKGHTRYVEFVLHGPAGATQADVRRAVNKFAQRKQPDGWSWSALRYGTTERTAKAGRVRELEELQGLLMQEDSITVGEM